MPSIFFAKSPSEICQQLLELGTAEIYSLRDFEIDGGDGSSDTMSVTRTNSFSNPERRIGNRPGSIAYKH